MAFSTMFYNEDPRRSNLASFWIVIGVIVIVIAQNLIERLIKKSDKWKYTTGVLKINDPSKGSKFSFDYFVDSIQYSSDRIIDDSCSNLEYYSLIGKTFVVRYDTKRPDKGFLLACRELRE